MMVTNNNENTTGRASYLPPEAVDEIVHRLANMMNRTNDNPAVAAAQFDEDAPPPEYEAGSSSNANAANHEQARPAKS